MRLNLPVTHHEFPFPPGATLVSVTDTKGRIVYCNEAFTQVSGYSMDELLGKPHNLIRHPDVPEEAFRDLWETIQSGRPWCTVIKNRRKDGSHYWVIANVTPLTEGGRPIGYMSVRTEPSREQIEQADALMSRMRAEKENGHIVTAFRNGRVVSLSTWGRLCERLRPSLSTMILSGLVLLAVTVAGITWWAGESSLPWAATSCAVAIPVLAIWALLQRSLVQPIDSLLECANRIAACDLTAVVSNQGGDHSYGEVHAALVQVSVNLQSIVRDARDQNTRIFANMGKLTQGQTELVRRTQAQASSLQQTAAALEQITSVATRTAESARAAASTSADVVAVTEQSAASMEELGVTIDSIREASNRIHDIIEVIDGIAFQTNILALNAAVEAARAGEAGKSFAVVASEVRALAQRTAAAAAEVAQLINETGGRVAQGHDRSREALASMEKAVAGIRSVHASVDDINHAMTEQLQGISQINTAVGSLDGATRENADFAASMAEATQQLERLAEATSESMKVFRTDRKPRELRDAVALSRQARRHVVAGARAVAAPPA